MSGSDEMAGPLLRAHGDEPARRVLELPEGRCVACCWRSPLKTDDLPCEDLVLVFDGGASGVLFAIADGAGGHQAGEQAARIVLETIHVAIAEHAAGQAPGLASTALGALEGANERVRALGVGAATTLAAASVREARVRTLHVGDSEIVLMGQRGRLRLQSVAHSPVGYAREAGLIDEDEALHHEDRHIVSNMIGTEDMRVEIAGATVMATRDTLLLASDGVFDNLYLGEIVEVCRKGALEKVADQLAARTRARMTSPEPGLPSKPDDLSFVLYRRRGRSSRERGA